MVRKLPVLMFLVILFFSTSLCPAGRPALDGDVAEQIIQRFVRLQAPVALKGWIYRERRLIESLAENGLVRKSVGAAYEWRIHGEERESRLLEVNGKPVIRSFVKEVAPPDLADLTLERVSQRYDFKVIKFERMQGLDVARVHFAPKRQQPRPRSRLEKVLSRLEGDLWMSLEDKQLVRAYALLSEPVKFGGGILGRVNKLEISYVQQKVGSQWVAQSLEFQVDMRRFLRAIRTREFRHYSEFQDGNSEENQSAALCEFSPSGMRQTVCEG
ncbi:MAG: hypothetical protein HY644_04130 [Acidobacteria bacterium]|nr:hypothetical protein [Acidobacteriota bacterium]